MGSAQVLLSTANPGVVFEKPCSFLAWPYASAVAWLASLGTDATRKVVPTNKVESLTQAARQDPLPDSYTRRVREEILPEHEFRGN